LLQAEIPNFFQFEIMRVEPYFGLIHNSDSKKIKFKTAVSAIRDKIVKNLHDMLTEEDEGQWIVWKRNCFELQFDQEETYTKILPNLRNAYVIAIAREFSKFILESVPIVEKFLKTIKQ
jgi:hypothetical protein